MKNILVRIKKELSDILLSILSVFSAFLLFGFVWWGYMDSGYPPLIIENRNTIPLTLFFFASDGGPATAFVQERYVLHIYPQASIKPNETIEASFSSSGNVPMGAFVKHGDIVRVWRFEAQQGGQVTLPIFSSLPLAEPDVAARTYNNWSPKGITSASLRTLIIGGTVLLWIRKWKKNRHSTV